MYYTGPQVCSSPTGKFQLFPHFNLSKMSAPMIPPVANQLDILTITFSSYQLLAVQLHISVLIFFDQLQKSRLPVLYSRIEECLTAVQHLTTV